MTLTRLVPRAVAKPWGRRDLAPWWPDVRADEAPVGEIWFEHPTDPDPVLLVKLLFTAARLSVQVHPDDAAAQAAGFARGKDEAWVVLDAAPPAEIGIGLTRAITPAELAVAAADGSIEALLDWQAVGIGEAFYSPAGTVHALGATLTLLEVQQNVDLTYRLYDYGSDRPLHLAEGVAVATGMRAYRGTTAIAPGRTLLASGPKLQVERWHGARSGSIIGPAVWLFAVAGAMRIGHDVLLPASSWYLASAAMIALGDDSDLIVAYAEATPIEGIFV